MGVLAGVGTGFVRAFDADTLGVAVGFPSPATNAGLQKCVFSPDGRYLAIARWNSSNSFAVFDIKTQALLPGLPTVASFINGIAWSSDGQYIALAHQNGKRLTVVNTSTWAIVPETPTIAGDAYAVAFSPDGAYLAVGHRNGSNLTVIAVDGWGTVSGTPALIDRVYGCAWSPDGAYLAAAHWNGKRLAIIDTEDWSVLPDTPTFSGNGQGCDFSPGGQYLAACFETIGYAVLNTSDFSLVQNVQAITGSAIDCKFSSDGVYLALSRNFNTESLLVIATSDWTLRHDLPVPGAVRGVAWTDSAEFARHNLTFIDSAGAPVQALTHIHTSSDHGNSVSVEANEAGELTFLAPYGLWVLAAGIDPGTGAYAARAMFAAEGQVVQHYTLSMPYMGPLATIAGNVTKQNGGGADDVVVFDWETRELVDRVTPDGTGDWSRDIRPGVFGISYFAEDCQPITHGPYTIEPD